MLGGQRGGIGSDLVRDITVGGDAIGTDDAHGDLARAHEARGGAIGDHRHWNPRTGELPRREAAALEQRTRLVDEHVHATARLMGEVDGRKRGSDPPRGERACIAVGEYARTVFDQRHRMLADPPAHRSIFLQESAGVAVERLENGRRGTGHVARTSEHPVERARQVDRGRSRGANAVRVRAEACVEALARLAGKCAERCDETHRAGDADGRCSTHRQPLDRVAHVIEGPEIELDEPCRQLGLVDDPYGVAVRRPADRLDDGHGQGT